MYNDVIIVTSDFDFGVDSNAYYTYYIVDASSNDITITFPPIEYDGYANQIVRRDVTDNGHTVTLLPASSADTINFGTSATLNNLHLCRICSLQSLISTTDWVVEFHNIAE